jgi:plasmid replication initiation protein
VGHRTISIDDLRYAIGCTNKYKTTRALKQEVINPAIKEINEKTSLKIACTDVKEGRKIVQFKFRVV